MSWGWSSRPSYGALCPSPTDVPLRVTMAVALVMGFGLALYRYAVVWTPLQREYLPTFAWSALMWGDGEVELLYLVDAAHRRPAIDEDVVTVRRTDGTTTFGLSEVAITAGAQRLERRRERYPYAQLHRHLRASIYGGQRLLHLAVPSVWTALVLLLGGVVGIRTQRFVEARRAREPSSFGSDAEPRPSSPAERAARPWPQEFFE